MPLTVIFKKQFQTLAHNRSDLEEQGLCRTGVPQLILGGVCLSLAPPWAGGFGSPRNAEAAALPPAGLHLHKHGAFLEISFPEIILAFSISSTGKVCGAGFVLAGVDLSSMI